MAGFGLIQTALVLMLVAGVLGAGALLLQAKRAPSQATGQEQTLRWADEAVAAFASANARLPCPATTVYGEEDCGAGGAKGWLPLRTLLGASGAAPQIGPVAYMVYRGDVAAHLDLTAPGNAWQPSLVDGSLRTLAAEGDTRRAFESVNGLDLCRALELAEAASADAALAHVPQRDGVSRNVAYGVAAAGAHAGDTRLDAANAGSGASMAAPSQAWDAAYDDRVRVRSFDGMAQTLGCRLLSGTVEIAPAARAFSGIPFLDPAATPATSYDVSLAAMDALAAAVTLHDSLKALQDENVTTTNAAVLGASMAQVGSVVKLVLAAAKVSDSVTSLTNNAASLARAVTTCIASLGITCWEVPLKATAVGLSVGSVINSAIALGLNIGAIPPTAMALAKTVEARDRAKNAAKERPQNLKATLDEMACQLYGNDPPEPPDGSSTPYNPCTAQNDIALDGDGKPVLKRDAYGAAIPQLDEHGRQMFDSNGTPLFEYEYTIDSNPKGLDEKRDEARADWQDLLARKTLLDNQRLVHWTDYNIRHYRIDKDATLNRHNGRYKIVRCVLVGDDKGDFRANGDACEGVSRVDGKMKGTHDRREELDLDLATADAIAQRELAKQWAQANLREREVEHEVAELRKNFDLWFNGVDGQKALFASMTEQKNDANHCGANPATDLSRQKCANATESLRYVDTCMRNVRDPATGTMSVQEDKDPTASCRLRLADRVAAAEREQQTIGSTRDGYRVAYERQLGPYIRYHHDWFEWALEEIEGSNERTRYEWRQSPRFGTVDFQGLRFPYYAPEPYGGSGSAPLLVWTNLELLDKKSCEFFNGWLGGSWDAYRHGVYCQRYPYNRAYSDWLLADKAAGEAKTIYDAMVAQFTELEAKYQDLRRTGQDVAGNVNASPVGFGAEAALERADARGSVGPQPVRGSP